MVNRQDVLMSESNRAYLEIIRQAQAGDRQSLDTLAEWVRDKVYPYIHRVTLEENRSQDLTQETLLAILESLGTLKKVDRFWPWVFTIATNKIRQYYRNELRRRAVQMSVIELPENLDSAGEGLAQLSRKELGELTRAAMTRLSERYRMILALRFYEDMSHAQIARVLGCTELNVRATFFRAKHALKRELSRRGIRESAMVVALSAFGELTMPSGASAALVAVSPSAVAETVVTGLLSLKAKLAVIVVAASLLSPWWWNMEVFEKNSANSLSREKVKFVHFVHQAPEGVKREDDGIKFESIASKGAYEEWCYFPDGPDESFLFRMQRWDPRQTQKLCWWVQNDEANYYIHAGEKNIFIVNWRLYYNDHSVKVLPTDTIEFCEFIRQIKMDDSEPGSEEKSITYKYDKASGLPTERADTRFEQLGEFKTTYDYSKQEMSLFNTPTGMPVIDIRDAMHKRGWTYFHVDGQLGDDSVSGVGRLPFVYGHSKKHSPWLKLDVNGKTVLIDNGRQACLFDADGTVLAAYPGGSFFTGLSRPWTGFHTLDTIRRDAAKELIWFSTEVIEAHKTARVTIVDDLQPEQYLSRYTVDMERDVLEKVEFWKGMNKPFIDALGQLTFTYLDELPASDDQYVMPRQVDVPPSASWAKASIFWPIHLFDVLMIKDAHPKIANNSN